MEGISLENAFTLRVVGLFFFFLTIQKHRTTLGDTTCVKIDPEKDFFYKLAKKLNLGIEIEKKRKSEKISSEKFKVKILYVRNENLNERKL
jgi:hypothetical protein